MASFIVGASRMRRRSNDEGEDRNLGDSPSFASRSGSNANGVRVIRGEAADHVRRTIARSISVVSDDSEGDSEVERLERELDIESSDSEEDNEVKVRRRHSTATEKALRHLAAKRRRRNRKRAESNDDKKSNKIVRALKQSVFAKFMSCQDMSPDDLDDGVNQMALLCAVILTIPYEVGQSVGYEYFDWLKVELSKCDRGLTGGYGIEQAMAAFREYMLCCMYSTMCGMILSTFYFLFKRSQPEDLEKYMRKCRYITIFIFVCCTFAILSLMALSNYLLSWFVLHTGGICEQTTGMQWYMFAALFFAFVALCLSIHLVW